MVLLGLNNTAVMGENAAFYPRLSILTQKYLAIPASHVPSERVFSLAGHLVKKNRARLSFFQILAISFHE
jgi:hypothetical protein